MTPVSDEKWMTRALALARSAEALGEVPVGAVIVKDNEIIAEGFNQPAGESNPLPRGVCTQQSTSRVGDAGPTWSM